MNLVRGVSRALGGSKAVRLQLCVNIDSLSIPDINYDSECVTIELERGKHKVQAETVYDTEKKALFLEDALNVPLTLFRDPKKGFKTKFFTLRAKNKEKKLIADMGQIDIANYAKVEGSTTLKLKGSGDITMEIRVECIFIEEAGDADDCSTIFEVSAQDQDLEGFDDLPSVVREELHAGNYTSDNGDTIEMPPGSPGHSIPRKSMSRKDKVGSTATRSSRTSKPSASPYRNLGAVEELARQLRVAKGERDDALHKLMEAQKLVEGQDTASTMLSLSERAEKAEKALEEAKTNYRSLEVEIKELNKSKEVLERSLKEKDKEIATYITDFNTLKGKSIAQEAEATSRLEALEARLKETSSLTQASSDETAKSTEAKVRSLQEVSDSLREQLELTRRVHGEAKQDLAALTAERNELKESLKTAELVTKQAVTRASTAETNASKLEERVAKMLKEQEEETEMTETREGAMRATAHFRIKELEEGMEALTQDHEQALAQAAELEQLVATLKASQSSSEQLESNNNLAALRLEYSTLLGDLAKLLNVGEECGQVKQAVEVQCSLVTSLEEKVKELSKPSSGSLEELAVLKEKHSALQLDREKAARNLLKLQKEFDALVAANANDEEKKALEASVNTLEKQLREEIASREKKIKTLEKDYSEKLAIAVKKEREAVGSASGEKQLQEIKKREKAVAAQEAALQYNQLRAADKEEEMLQLVVGAKLSYAQAKEELDGLRRENSKLTQLVSEVKGQLANAKAAHEDMEATCQHALAGNKASMQELESLKKSTKRASGSFSLFTR